MVATPELSDTVPMPVPSTVNVTVPVASDGETVAVRVVLCPTIEGFTEEVSVVVEPGVITTFVMTSDPRNLSSESKLDPLAVNPNGRPAVSVIDPVPETLNPPETPPLGNKVVVLHTVPVKDWS